MKARSNTAFLVLALGIVLLAAGCRGDRKDDRADALRRAVAEAKPLPEFLSTFPADTLLLVSVHGEDLPDTLPPLGEGGRIVSATDGPALVVAKPDALAKLAALPGVDSLLFWGPGDCVGRLDSWLRGDLLARLDAGDESPLAAIATFADPDNDQTAELEALGARVGSRSGRIVTLEAPPATLLKVLVRDDLVRLKKPTPLKPSAIR